GKLLIEHTRPSWFIFSDGFKKTPLRSFYKTSFDLLCATIGLILTAPLMPLIALAIRIDSPGPVFFRQVRVGESGRKFRICKFRTMSQDAEKKTGAVWATENDPRITRVGKILRKTRLDELPQIFNVLKGDMSIVGPRPERPEFIEELSRIIPYYGVRHAIKPGITGWAQIKYSYGASVDDAVEKLRYDLYYIKHCSLIFDLLIVIETIKVVLFGKGAR
ncbi:MAG: exopolysaccharide biosynthesis polyprenyl glycosylphosphotransferase, partial [Desulfobacteraceae bacterium]|nr:exopolysaccharide biosynthesis polyprenyl glycosylphosphotransferase [Desulfobacteraceae bacterium]